jgi:hypothetical protein
MFTNQHRCQNKINHLPLTIFLSLQSQGSQLHNEWLFCSIKSFFYIPKGLFLVGVIEFSNPPIQHADRGVPKVTGKVCPNKSNGVSNSSSGSLIAKYRIMENSMFNREGKQRRAHPHSRVQRDYFCLTSPHG